MRKESFWKIAIAEGTKKLMYVREVKIELGHELAMSQGRL